MTTGAALHAGAYGELLAVMQDYFDGLYHSDTQRLRRVFHPQALYACATDEPLLVRDMPGYFAVVDQRPSPASRGEPRHDEVLGIEFAGPVTAVVRARCAIAPKHFIDLLTFVKTGGRWQLIAKVFHHQALALAA